MREFQIPVVITYPITPRAFDGMTSFQPDDARVKLAEFSFDSDWANFVTLADETPVKLRLLQPNDEDRLFNFFDCLSEASRRHTMYHREADRANARRHCSEIGRSDKLRIVGVHPSNTVIALFEFSLELHPTDVDRYMEYGIRLDQETDGRFAPCIADAWHGSGLAGQSWEVLRCLALDLGQKRLILWGGVQESNLRAVQFYRRLGFYQASKFTNPEGVPSIDMWIRLDTLPIQSQ